MEQQQQQQQPNSNGTITHHEQTPPPPPNGFSYTKFNTALNAGLLNPMSPPPPPLLDSTKPIITTPARSSPTLFEMMANEQDSGIHNNPRPQTTATAPFPPSHHHYPNNKHHHHHPPPPPSSSSLTLQERQLLLQERVAEIMGSCNSPGNPLNHHHQEHDVRLTLTSKDGLSVTMSVHRHVLVGSSRFFASKLSDHWSRQQRSLPHLVEISDCDDVEVYVETLRLMYSSDPRRLLLREDVPKVLSILKVCAAIAFEEGVVACLEYLEAAPWAEEEEEKVAELLSQLQLGSSGAVGEVLKRVCADPLPPDESNNNNEETLMRLLHVVLEGKDEKARRDMKGLVSKMLRENNTTTTAAAATNKNNNDLSKDSLYSAFHSCLDHLCLRVSEAAAGDLSHAAQIARQADNIHWLLDILIDRQLAEEVLITWAGQADLAELHPRVPSIHRYEVSRVTARLFVGVGKGQVLVPKEARWMLLKTWLEPFYEDFGWMRRACKGLDRYSVEDGLASTVLTLPLPMQQELFLAWFDRFLNMGDEYCPNLQKGFEVWWRRAFWKRRSGGGDGAEQLRLATSSQQQS